MYHYTDSYQKAINLKIVIEKFLGKPGLSDEVKQGIQFAAGVFKVTVTNQFFSGCLIKLYVKKRREALLYQSLNEISNRAQRLNAPLIEEWEANLPQVKADEEGKLGVA